MQMVVEDAPRRVWVNRPDSASRERSLTGRRLPTLDQNQIIAFASGTRDDPLPVEFISGGRLLALELPRPQLPFRIIIDPVHTSRALSTLWRSH